VKADWNGKKARAISKVINKGEELGLFIKESLLIHFSSILFFYCQ
jgi:hypothetical protein